MLFTSSIRRILYVIAFLVILPALSIIVYTGLESRKHGIEYMNMRCASLLNNLGGRFRMQIESTRAMLRALAATDVAHKLSVDRAGVLLRHIKHTGDKYVNIGIVDEKGKILVSALSIGDNEYALHPSMLDKNPPSGFAGGHLVREPASAEEAIFYTLFSACKKGGKGFFYAVWLRPSKLLKVTEKAFGTSKGLLRLWGRKGSLAYSYAPNGFLANLSDDPNAWHELSSFADDQGLFSKEEEDGDKFLIAYDRIRLGGVPEPVVVIELCMSKEEAYAEPDAALLRNILLLALAALGAVGIAYFFGDRLLVMPINKLASTARFIAGGRLETRASGMHLKGELGQLAGTFDEMAVALEARNRELVNAKNAADIASKAKSDFLANMSHEIRTPMNTVTGMAYLALKSDLSSKQQTYVNKIFAAANTLLRIINDIMDFSKIEAGKLDMEYSEFSLDDILDNIASLVSQKADEKGLEVLFGIDSNVPNCLVGDTLRLGQILTNLLNNAVKFTNKGEIIVSCALEATLEERVRLGFMVKDTGIGMTQEQQDRLFTAFTQADGSITRRFGGTGLGLIITKRLIERMGGTIQVLSEPGKGTIITFSAIFDLPQSPAAQAGKLQGNLARILVVDDNEPACRMIQNMLNNMRFRADCADSPAEAFAMLWQADGTDPYRVVLMDWRLPGMDGVEATWRLRTELSLAYTPTVFITTTIGRSEVLQQAVKAGAVGVIYKPVNKKILFESIMRALQDKTAITAGTDDSLSSLHVQGQVSFPNARVLVVEDNPINQQVATELLESAKITVTAVDNGEQAIMAVEQSAYSPPFDLMILDLQMPEMDGYETAARIRTNPRSSNMPIVVMTAHALVEDRQRCIDAGMNDYISKPIEVDKFFSALSRWLPKIDGEEASMQKECSSQEPAEGAGIRTRTASVAEGALFLPGLETEKALVRLGNNERLYVKLLKQFLTYYGNTDVQFNTAFMSGDTGTAQRIAHTLKGLAGSIGASALAEKSALLEASFAFGDAEKTLRLAKNCFDGLADVQEILKEAFAGEEHEGDADKETDAPSLTDEQQKRKSALLEKLVAFLKDDDAEASTFFINHGREFSALLSGESFSRLKTNISRFQFEEALEWIASSEKAAHSGE